MYNRYVPQSDGSFRRSRIPEPIPQQENIVDAVPPPREPERKEASANPGSSLPPQRRRFPASTGNPPRPQYTPHCEQPSPSIGSFLKGLLPQNFDTEDLMVVLLLLLMSGNSGNDQNAALMTLVIYLFI